MRTKLDRLLESIDPTRPIDETAARVDGALNSFRLHAARITDWGEFKWCVARLVCHVRNTVLRPQPPLAVDRVFDWDKGCKALQREYGASGEKTAFEKARTGNEGGLYSVIKGIANQLTEEYTENEIRSRIGRFWEQLSFEEQSGVADEYLAKYGYLLPSEMTEASAGRLRANILKVLEEHPRLVRSLRYASR
ncbi:MAG: hypothetical protein ABIH23_26920 [bacterium]